MPRLKTPRLVMGTRIAVASELCLSRRQIAFLGPYSEGISFQAQEQSS